MDLARHCDLCDNQKTSLKEGIICGLTDQKPEFNITCTKIELNEKFELKLKDVNIRFQKVDGAKVLTYIYFIVFLTIGFAVMIGGYLLGKYALDSGVISTVPIIIIAIGLAPIAMAFGALNKYRLDLEISKNKKNRIDQVLKLYRIEYVIDIKFGKEYHGTQDVYADLKFKGNRCGAFK